MRTSRWVTAAVVGFVATGCGPGPAVDLKAAALLEGDWNLVLTVEPAPGRSESLEIRGTMALLVNRAGTKAPDFAGVPQNVGVHDLILGSLSPGLGGRGVPDVVGGVAGDSAVVIIGPGAGRPIQLRGRFTTDSVVGRWTVYQRAGPGYDGGFVMTKRSP